MLLRESEESSASWFYDRGRAPRSSYIDKRGIPTADGIQVGEIEARAKKVYGSSLAVTPSQYTAEEGGHYLTLQSPDGRYGIRFETEKGNITTFYAGTYAAIQYVEGCE